MVGPLDLNCPSAIELILLPKAVCERHW